MLKMCHKASLLYLERRELLCWGSTSWCRTSMQVVWHPGTPAALASNKAHRGPSGEAGRGAEQQGERRGRLGLAEEWGKWWVPPLDLQSPHWAGQPDMELLESPLPV